MAGGPAEQRHDSQVGSISKFWYDDEDDEFGIKLDTGETVLIIDRDRGLHVRVKTPTAVPRKNMGAFLLQPIPSKLGLFTLEMRYRDGMESAHQITIGITPGTESVYEWLGHVNALYQQK